ncbi:hypothetical protein NL676_027240 [Syzygium grande]|nr:hypothetical protein NL676_027240 [Syzygium grande]
MLPSDDCFAHLEVQFRFFRLLPKVDSALGWTYQPDCVKPAKPSVALPVVGGEDKYRTTSLISAGCKLCLYAPGSDNEDRESSLATTTSMAYWIAPEVSPSVLVMA